MISATGCISYDITREKKGPAALGDALTRSFKVKHEASRFNTGYNFQRVFYAKEKTPAANYYNNISSHYNVSFYQRLDDSAPLYKS